MKKFIHFSFALYGKIKENEILPLAAQMTYRLIFSLFPFIIFLISLVSLFDIDTNFLMEEVFAFFPLQIAQVIEGVIQDVTSVRNPNVMSVSLLFSVFTVAGGLKAVMRGVNKVYGQEDGRSPIVQWIYCTLLVIMLAVAIIASLLIIIFGDIIYAAIAQAFGLHGVLDVIFGFAGVLITITIMLAAIILIYRLSSRKKHPITSLLPGAMLTIAVWAASSSAFNFYINNFSRYSLVYGSIASIFITMLWLNIISATILIGAQTNALLEVKR